MLQLGACRKKPQLRIQQRELMSCLVVEQDPEGNRQRQPGLAPSDCAQPKRQEAQATVHGMPDIPCSSVTKQM